MRRVPADTPDVSLDLHGSGKHGFKDRNLPATDGTEVDERILNSLQEELSRFVEGFGDRLAGSVADGTGETFLQLRDRLRAVFDLTAFGSWRTPTNISPRMGIGGVSGLNANIDEGWIVLKGRVFHPTDEWLVDNGHRPHTYTANKDTYISMNADGDITYTEVNNGAGRPATPGGEEMVFKVVTNGTTITDSTYLLPKFPELKPFRVHGQGRGQPAASSGEEYMRIGALPSDYESDTDEPRTDIIKGVGEAQTTDGNYLAKTIPHANFNMANGENFWVRAWIVGTDAADVSNNYGTWIHAQLEMTGGTALGTHSKVAENDNSTGAAADADVVVTTGGIVQLRVRGVTSETWNWRYMYEIMPSMERAT